MPRRKSEPGKTVVFPNEEEEEEEEEGEEENEELSESDFKLDDEDDEDDDEEEPPVKPRRKTKTPKKKVTFKKTKKPVLWSNKKLTGISTEAGLLLEAIAESEGVRDAKKKRIIKRRISTVFQILLLLHRNY